MQGKDIGRYHILEPLGEGGMADVYKAFDTHLEAEVAVKVIRIDELPPKLLARTLKRFEREAKSLARLNHPNIVNVTDYGEFEGKPYLVMPYIQSGTLKEMLKGKAMRWQDAAQRLIPIAKALGYAHQQEMIHRDVKPSNILITTTGEPILTDFGVAKIIDDNATMDLTGTHATVGTPEYMAPEQVTAKTVDHRADIYALGVVFYEMVTGRKPFQADTPMAVLFKHASEPLPRPTQFAPKLPKRVEQILLKTLAKDPVNRYQNMAEFVAALESVVNEKSAQKDSKRKSKLSIKWKSRKEKEPDSIGAPKWIWWIILMGIGLGLFVGAFSWISSRAPVRLISLSTPTPTKIITPAFTKTLTANSIVKATSTLTPVTTSTPTKLSVMPIAGTWEGKTTGTKGDIPISEKIALLSIPIDCKLGFACGQFSTEGACTYDMTLIDVQDNLYTFESLSISGEDFCLDNNKNSVKLTLISESNLDFYFYHQGSDVIRRGVLSFKSSTATDASTLIPRLQEVFHSDFENGLATGFSIVYGNAKVISDEVDNQVLQIGPSDSSWPVVEFLSDLNDFAIQYRFRQMECNTNCNFNFWYRGVYRGSMSGYEFLVQPQYNLLKLQYQDSSSSYTLSKKNNFELSPGEWYEIRVEAFDNYTTIYIDGIEVVSTKTDTEKFAKIAFHVDKEAAYQVDDIVVWEVVKSGQ
jgi:serine/threonine protein kinase